MAFCTNCGANVPGAFCSQCGTPVNAGAPAQPAAANQYAQPAVAGAMPPRKTSPIVWVLVIVLGFFVLSGVAVMGVVALVAHKVHQAGVRFDRNKDGSFAIQARDANGKNARVEIGSSMANLPKWVPVYPGSDAQGAFSVQGGDAEGGTFTFTTSDDVSRVKTFYADKIRDLGMKVDVDTTTSDGSMMIAADEGGERRSLTVTLGGHAGRTTVNVVYALK